MIVVGVGCGPGMLTMDAIDHIRRATRIYGSERALEMARPYIQPGCEAIAIKDYSRLRELPDDAVVLSTGDPMLAGLGHLGEVVVPGISSLQYSFSRLHLPLTRAVVIDAHGKDGDAARREMLEELIRGRIPFVLTEPKFDIHALAGMLREMGLACKMILCENLGYPDERIVFGDELSPPYTSSTLYSLVLVREAYR